MGSSTHHTIVALETHFCPIPKIELPSPFTFDLIEYDRTPISEIQARIADATILITTIIPLTAETLSEECCPRLEFISVMAVGTDTIDLAACKKRGIVVSNCSGANVIPCAEHAISSYFGLRRRLILSYLGMRANGWVEKGSLLSLVRDGDDKAPITCSDETMGIVGFGQIGKRVALIAQSLGMKVLVADRKANHAIVDGRVSFREVVKESTIIVLTLPRSPETMNLFSTAEFNEMRRHALLVNISRGGIVDEEALLKALREKQIAGAAVDVFVKEPAGPETSVLLRAENEDLNFIATPHTAWYAEQTFVNYQNMIHEDIVAWCLGKPVRVVV
ncbi:hypothetical protein NA57DRAFT_56109 [Rhizodiscina lignyota]|uniref:Glycerate dehydrogenase n=1 Tax=Rhizodiscina lignyota TaxID=1504668 RepID=A0A9P4IFL8_9PEZI|nr:hypothetical protein NA57DRAFT_56109 [Rhizodiscina lignyota]